MFRNIVVPADLTDRNRDAIAMAARLVESERGKVHLLHVIETIPGFSLDEEKEFYEKLEKAATRHLEKLAEPLREAGIPFRAEVVYGPRAKTILEEAERLDADLIVMRSHRALAKGGQAQEGWGTLSYQIGIFAALPVLLVK